MNVIRISMGCEKHRQPAGFPSRAKPAGRCEQIRKTSGQRAGCSHGKSYWRL